MAKSKTNGYESGDALRDARRTRAYCGAARAHARAHTQTHTRSECAASRQLEHNYSKATHCSVHNTWRRHKARTHTTQRAASSALVECGATHAVGTGDKHATRVRSACRATELASRSAMLRVRLREQWRGTALGAERRGDERSVMHKAHALLVTH